MTERKTSIGAQPLISSEGWGKSSYCSTDSCVEIKNWRTAKASGFQDCVSVRSDSTEVKIRDSKFPDMPHLALSKNQFETLLTVLKNS